MNTVILLPVVIFLIVSGLVVAVAFVLRDGSPKTSARLDQLIGKRRKEDESADILRRSALEGDRKSLLEMLTPKFLSMGRYFEQADCHIRPSTLMGISIVLGVLGTTGSLLARVPWYLTPLGGALLFMIPWGWLWNKRRARLATFAAQMPEGLELVARALRAGHSLAAGMHVVAEEMPSPIADEFGRVYEEQNYGIPLEESMDSMCNRVPNLDLKFFVTSVAIQRQTGGDLAEILDKIGYVIRERYRILGQVKALTGEGRLSGIVLIALPFVLFIVMLHINPQYVSTLWTHPTGIKMAIFGLVLQILGALVIRKIVNIKV
jgi:tight adherence protein B